MSKKTYTCAVCGHHSPTTLDHASHTTTAHDLGRRGRDKCRRRPVSCWRCASDIEIQDTTKCHCGFDLADHGYHTPN